MLNIKQIMLVILVIYTFIFMTIKIINSNQTIELYECVINEQSRIIENYFDLSETSDDVRQRYRASIKNMLKITR